MLVRGGLEFNTYFVFRLDGTISLNVGLVASRSTLASSTMSAFAGLNTDHKDLIHDVSYNHNGQLMATSSSDQKIKIWKNKGSDQEPHWVLLQEIYRYQPSSAKSPSATHTHKASITTVEWASPVFGCILASCSTDRVVNIFVRREPTPKLGNRQNRHRPRLHGFKFEQVLTNRDATGHRTNTQFTNCPPIHCHWMQSGVPMDPIEGRVDCLCPSASGPATGHPVQRGEDQLCQSEGGQIRVQPLSVAIDCAPRPHQSNHPQSGDLSLSRVAFECQRTAIPPERLYDCICFEPRSNVNGAGHSDLTYTEAVLYGVECVEVGIACIRSGCR